MIGHGERTEFGLPLLNNGKPVGDGRVHFEKLAQNMQKFFVTFYEIVLFRVYQRNILSIFTFELIAILFINNVASKAVIDSVRIESQKLFQ